MRKKIIVNSICIINCFDTYEHRVDILHDYFKTKGMSVTVYVSNFRHFKKKIRDDHKIDYRYIEAMQYKKNLSISRIKSHIKFSKDVFKEVRKGKYDLIWILIPPNSLIKEAARYKNEHCDVKMIFDIIDIWPETMPFSFFKHSTFFQYWKMLRDSYVDVADSIVVECALYKTVLPKKICEDKINILYLAKKVNKFTHSYNLDDKKIALCYLGSINNIIDIQTISKIISYLNEHQPVVLNIIGDGEKKDELIRRAIDAGAEVVDHGIIYDSVRKREILNSCHYGLNIMKKNVVVGLTMKSIDYFESGIPIINNIKGDTWDICNEKKVGINVDENFKNNVLDYDERMRINSRNFFENYLSLDAFEYKVDNIIKQMERKSK